MGQGSTLVFYGPRPSLVSSTRGFPDQLLVPLPNCTENVYLDIEDEDEGIKSIKEPLPPGKAISFKTDLYLDIALVLNF